MGKTGGFLETGRKDPGYRPREERVKDFKEVERQFPPDVVTNQASRCMGCGTPFCHTTGCPLDNVIPEFNELVYRGNWEEAFRMLASTASFPEFTGRLCPAPCETACVLDGCQDDAVTIREIELSIIETAFQQGYIRPSPPARRFNQQVAVIGAGPAGLAVADYLNRAGYSVVVYDKAEKPGGIMRYGIPDFKMEKWVVDRRIGLMQREGVEFEMGVVAGDDVSYRYLSKRYAAIALCFGSRTPRDLPVEGRELDGVHFAMDFLIRQNKMNAGERYDTRESLNAKGKSVVVIGGGDTGSDCVGTSVRQGAKKVYQLEILPKPAVKRPDHTPWPGWPAILRESSSHKEGGERMWSVATKAFIGEDGKLKGLKGVEVTWEKDGSGNWQMKDVPGTEFELETELVLLAMGFTGPRPSRLLEELDISMNARGNVEVNENHMTKVPGVFAAGDMAMGQSLIVSALADGRKTAQSIIKYLSESKRTSIV